MKTFKQLLTEHNACSYGMEWMGNRTIEEYIRDADRGDWMLWLARKIKLPLQIRTLAKAHCAGTVLYLMKDERSKNAVKVAIAFGEGNASREELDAAAAAADAAYAAADADAATYAAYAAAYVAAAADAAADAADAAADAYAYAAADAAYAADARTKNQKETAEICRKYLGDLIIQKVNLLLQ